MPFQRIKDSATSRLEILLCHDLVFIGRLAVWFFPETRLKPPPDFQIQAIAGNLILPKDSQIGFCQTDVTEQMVVQESQILRPKQLSDSLPYSLQGIAEQILQVRVPGGQSRP